MSTPVGLGQHGTDESKAETEDSARKRLCRIGGYATLAALATTSALSTVLFTSASILVLAFWILIARMPFQLGRGEAC